MTRGADGWTLAEKGGYRADTGKLREFLLKLADAKLIEQKTSNKDKYATLGVEDVAAKDAKGVEVELGGLGARPVKLIVGNSQRAWRNVRAPRGEAQSWLASGTLTVDKKGGELAAQGSADMAATRIAVVEITHAGRQDGARAKDGRGRSNFNLADVPKGREAGSEYAVNGLASTLGGLRFDDVIAAKDAPPGDKAAEGALRDVRRRRRRRRPRGRRTASIMRSSSRRPTGTREASTSLREQAKAKADDDGESAPMRRRMAPETPKMQRGMALQTAEPCEVGSAAPRSSKRSRDEARRRSTRKSPISTRVSRIGPIVLPPYKYANINKATDDLLKPLEEKKRRKEEGADTKKPAVSPAKKAG